MRRELKYFMFLFIVFFFAKCTETISDHKVIEELETSTDTINCTRDFVALKEDKLRTKFFKWVNEDMHLYLKNLCDCHSTTASHTQVNNYFYKPDYEGLYGIYILIANEADALTYLIGTMLVFEPDSIPGLYCTDNNEEFISFFASDTGFFSNPDFCKEILLYNNIKVGATEKYLVDILGSPQQIIDEKIIYHDFENTIAVFDIYKGKILSILIGKYIIEWESKGVIKNQFLEKIIRTETVNY